MKYLKKFKKLHPVRSDYLLQSPETTSKPNLQSFFNFFKYFIGFLHIS